MIQNHCVGHIPTSGSSLAVKHPVDLFGIIPRQIVLRSNLPYCFWHQAGAQSDLGSEMIKAVTWRPEPSRGSALSVFGLTEASSHSYPLGDMDTNSTPWTSGSPPALLPLHVEGATAAPTIFPRPMSIMIFSLAVSDLMIGLCGSLVVTITNYHGSFFIGHTACVFQGFSVNYFGLVSLCTLTLLAYERYNVVCKPSLGLRLSMRRSITGLLFVWFFCLFWAVTPLFGWSSYGPEGVQTSCSLAWEERSWSNYSYLILYTLLCFILPVTIIIYCYYKVLKYMMKLNRSVELQGGRPSQKENDHAITMVLAMIVAFFVCWLPYTALSVVVVVDPELYIPPLFATMPMYFAKTSPVYNPIIYFLSNKQFRDCTLDVLSCGRYIPHGPAAVTIRMRPLNKRSWASSFGRNINAQSKVLPL